MKKSIAFLVAIAISVMTLTGCSKKHTDPNNPPKPQVEEPKPQPESVVTKEEISAFFTEKLNGKTTDFKPNQSLTTAQIAEAQQMVWQVWKQANQQFSEEKLIALTSHSGRKSGSWQLPATLEANAVMPYYYGSKNSKPADGYPLFLYLHGSGDKNSEWESGWQIANIHNVPAVYFIPQIPNTGELYRWYQKSKQFAWEKLLRLAFLSGDVNANRVYFYGVSEGGYGSQRLASFYADYLAGAGPMAGGEPLINAPVENCRNIGFEFITGENDFMFHRNTLTRYTKEAFEKFRQTDPEGFAHNVELEKYSGHGVAYSKMVPRLEKYTRNPHPKRVVWEDFPMHDAYRTGFYNLTVQERAAERTRYTMDIVGNRVHISVDEVTYQGTETSPQWKFFLKYDKTFKPVQKGKFTIYFNDKLLNLNEEVVIIVNGKEMFKGMLKADVQHIVKSCATFFDPERLFPTAVEISF
ncbi:hypothetical protein [Capnocytophaga sp.]|uniref:hypothetical protein n=1 Tax=Capnocytophaga sp. TaxID=44737 RepID=UPI0026DBD83A|nr:hypothetical protein [Capnocytophaga sp.]MDO5106505.1 hypothetical protein [Capnocytophaga sp.]